MVRLVIYVRSVDLGMKIRGLSKLFPMTIPVSTLISLEAARPAKLRAKLGRSSQQFRNGCHILVGLAGGRCFEKALVGA